MNRKPLHHRGVHKATQPDTGEHDRTEALSSERRWGTKADVAQYLNLSTKTVDRLTERGVIRAYPLGPRLLRYDLNEIDAALAAATGEATT